MSDDALDALPVRARNCLRNEGIRTPEQAAAKTYLDLWRIPNMGRKSISDVVAWLGKHGMQLTGPYDDKFAFPTSGVMHQAVQFVEAVGGTWEGRRSEFPYVTGLDAAVIRKLLAKEKRTCPCCGLVTGIRVRLP